MKQCTRCKVILPESAFQLKRTGELYLHCNKCRKVSSYGSGDSGAKDTPLEEHLVQLSRRIDVLQKELAGFQTLQKNGYVYAPQRRHERFTARELLVKVVPEIIETDFFNMGFGPNMPEEVYVRQKQKKAFMIRLGKHLNSEHRKEFKCASDRTKCIRSIDDMTKGLSTTGCLFPEDYTQHVEAFIASASPTLDYLMNSEARPTGDSKARPTGDSEDRPTGDSDALIKTSP